MKQKTSMFGSAMSSYSKPEQSNGETLEPRKKVGRPKGSIKKIPTKSSFTTKLDNELLSILKKISEEKSQPINRIIEDCVKYTLISIGREELFHDEIHSIKDQTLQSRNDLVIVADRYKRLKLK